MGLDTLLGQLSALCAVVYGSEDNAACAISFNEFDGLAGVERLDVLLRDSSDGTFLPNLRSRALPFLSQLATNSPEAADAGEALLLQYMEFLAARGQIGWCARILQASQPSPHALPQPRIIERTPTLIQAALACVYACTSTDATAFQFMNAILEVT